MSFNIYFDKFTKTKIYTFIHPKIVNMRRRKIKKKIVPLQIYFGLPGSGKTTVAAYLARQYKRAELPVFTNEPVKDCSIIEKSDFGVYDLCGGSEKLVILDEAGVYYNNRDFKSNFNEISRNYFLRCRHDLASIAIFAQGWSMCDKLFRDIAYKYWYCTKSIIPGFITLTPMKRKLGIDELTHQPVDMFYFPHPILRLFMCKHVFGPLVWGDFDSWSMPPMKKKIWRKW